MISSPWLKLDGESWVDETELSWFWNKCLEQWFHVPKAAREIRLWASPEPFEHGHEFVRSEEAWEIKFTHHPRVWIDLEFAMDEWLDDVARPDEKAFIGVEWQ